MVEYYYVQFRQSRWRNSFSIFYIKKIQSGYLVREKGMYKNNFFVNSGKDFID